MSIITQSRPPRRTGPGSCRDRAAASDLGVRVDRRLEHGADDDGVAAIGQVEQQGGQIVDPVDPERVDLEQRRLLGRLDAGGA